LPYIEPYRSPYTNTLTQLIGAQGEARARVVTAVTETYAG
jgi:hypothetical protein